MVTQKKTHTVSLSRVNNIGNKDYKIKEVYSADTAKAQCRQSQLSCCSTKKEVYSVSTSKSQSHLTYMSRVNNLGSKSPKKKEVHSGNTSKAQRRQSQLSCFSTKKEVYSVSTSKSQSHLTCCDANKEE
eukprot:9779205-Heterocapsa_arctica.AAC.1